MNFDFKSQGWTHKFKMDRNELIIKCYDYNEYHIGSIRIILNDSEKADLISILGEEQDE